MKRGLPPLGYTIVEVMIFLAVTGILLVSALSVMNGQQSRTQFTQGLREMDAKIRGVSNDVSSGFYPGSSNFICTISGGFPLLVSGASSQGSNTPCTFLGKVIQFGPTSANCTDSDSSNCNQYSIVTVIGKRQETTVTPVKEVTSLDDPDGSGGPLTGARPTATLDSTNPNLDLTDKGAIPWSLRVYRMYEVRGIATPDIAAVGFITTLASYSGTDPISGSQSVTMLGVQGSKLGDTDVQIATNIRGMKEADRNPDQVVVCFTEPGASVTRKGAIVLGGQGKQLTTEVFIDSNTDNVPGGGC